MHGYANLSIEITEVLGTKNIVSKFPRDIGVANGKVVDVYIYSPTFEDPAVNSGHIASMFLQKQLTMGIAVLFSDVLKDGVRVKDYLGGPPYFARIWPIDEHGWIAKVLSTSDGNACPK